VNNELERIWKNAVVAYQGTIPVELRRTRNPTIRTAGIPTEGLLNTALSACSVKLKNTLNVEDT
jgi:hypothetical protein